MENRKNNEKGITLVALVITIIVLVILVGVSVSTVLNTGLIGNSKKAVAQYREVQTEEEIEVDKVAKMLDAASAKQISAGEYAGDSNRKFVSDGKTAYIPAGFTVSGIDGEDTIDKGLVIYTNKMTEAEDEETAEEYMAEIKKGTSGYTVEGLRGKYNQYVWIPVENPSDIYGIDKDGNKLGKLYSFGTTGNWATSSSQAKKCNWTETNGVMRLTFKNSNNEPEFLNKTSYAINSADGSKYNDDGNGNKVITEDELKYEFNRMISSVEAYKGFYIGRYEVTGNIDDPTILKGFRATTTSWYEFYLATKKIEKCNNWCKAHTSIIWGCQWDQVIKKSLDATQNDDGISDFLSNPKDYGVYGYQHIVSGDEQKTAYNIYDLSGNEIEWTMESDLNAYRVQRGGIKLDKLDKGGASRRYGSYPYYGGGCRVQLYL